MKAYHTLGILRLAICSYLGFTILWGLQGVFYATNFTPTPDWWISVFVCLLYLSGVVPSIFLLRGSGWARKYVGAVAIITVLACASLALWKKLPTSLYVLGAFAVLSAIVLLPAQRRAEPGASRNGGPTEPTGNSGVSRSGPPSVS